MKSLNYLSQQLIDVNDELLTVEQVAEMMKVKPASIRKRIQRGTIPSYKKPGSKRRWFSKVELIAYMKS